MKLSLAMIGVTALCVALAAPLLDAAQDEKPGVVFEDTTRLLRESLAAAKESGRMVMLDLFLEDAEPCTLYHDKTFADPAVAALMKGFVNVTINSEYGEGPSLRKGYKLMAYPTLFFLDGDGLEVDRIVGYLQAEKFIERVKEIQAGKNTYRSLKALYEKDKSDLDSAVAYAGKLQQRADRDDQTLAITIYEETLEAARKEKLPVAGDCLSKLIEQKLRSRDIDGAATLIEEQIADYPKSKNIESSYHVLAQIEAQIRKNLDRAIELMQKAVELVDGQSRENGFRVNLLEYLEEKGDFDGALAQLDELDVDDPMAVFGDKVRLFVKKGDRERAETFCREWFAKAGNDPEKINGVVWACHENKILLAEALGWAKKMMALCEEEIPALIDTYAWLLFDNGDAEAAAEWEEKALFAAETNEENETYAAALKKFREAAEKADG